MFKLILIGALFYSCAWKSEQLLQDENNEASITPSFIDSDGDWISDADEIESGSDPYIANIPVINVKENLAGQIQFNVDVAEGERNQVIALESDQDRSIENDIFRRYLLREAAIRASSGNTELSWQLDKRFQNLIPVNSWNFAKRFATETAIDDYVAQKAQFVSHSGKINLSYQLEPEAHPAFLSATDFALSLYSLNSAFKLSRIGTQLAISEAGKNIELNLGEGVDANTSERLLRLGYLNLSPFLMNNIIKNDDQIYVSIDSTKFKLKDGRELLSASYFNGINSKTARVIVSTPDETTTYHVAVGINGVSDYLEQFVVRLKKNVASDADGSIIKIGDYESDLRLPFDFINVTKENLERKLWIILSNDGLGLESPLIEGESYAVVYASVLDLLGALKEKKTILTSKTLLHKENAPTHFSLGKVKAGDVLTLKFSGKQKQYGVQARIMPMQTWRWSSDCNSCGLYGLTCNGGQNGLYTIVYKKYLWESFNECAPASQDAPPNFPVAGGTIGGHSLGCGDVYMCFRRATRRHDANCTANYLDKVIVEDAPLPIYEDLSNYRLNLIIGKKSYDLDSAKEKHLIADQSFLKRGIIQFEVETNDILNIEEDAFLEILPDENQNATSYGFVSDNCAWPDKTPVDTTKHQFFAGKIQEYSIDLSVEGIPRSLWEEGGRIYE